MELGFIISIFQRKINPLLSSESLAFISKATKGYLKSKEQKV